MNSNIQRQRGYALFIVLGLMVLSSIGVVATYKAVSSYDQKSGTSFKHRKAKEITEAGSRAVEAYLSDKSLDALGVLQQMYLEKVTDSLDVVPVKINLNKLNQSTSEFDVYFTDVTWESPHLFITTKILGTSVHGDSSRVAQNITYKVGGLTVNELGITTGSDMTCLPDLGLYLGGKQQVNLNSTLHLIGGLYSTNMQTGSGLSVVGTAALSDEWTQESVYNGFSLEEGNYFLSHRAVFPGATVVFKNSLELASDARIGNAGNTDFLDLEIRGNLYLNEWDGLIEKSGVNKHVKFTVAGDLIVKGDFKLEGDSRLTIEVEGDVVFLDDLSKNTINAPYLTLEFGGDLLFYGGIQLDVNGNRNNRDLIYNESSARVYSANGSGILPTNSLECNGDFANCNTTSTEPTDWVNDYIFISDEMGLDKDNNWQKSIDIRISDDMLTKRHTWWELWKKAYDANVISTPAPANVNGSYTFDIDLANTMAADEAFVADNGHNGFLILDIIDASHTSQQPQNVFSGKNSNNVGKELTGKWTFLAHDRPGSTKKVQFSSSACFPQMSPSARVLYWTDQNSSFAYCGTDFYGMIYYDHDDCFNIAKGTGTACNNFFLSDIYVHGAVYASSGNAKFFSGTMTIELDLGVLQDLSPAGLVKYDAKGNVVMNCSTGEDGNGNVVATAPTYEHVASTLEAKSSQLSVTKVGVASEMNIDEIEADMISNSAERMETPYLGFTQSKVMIANGSYSDLEDLMANTNFRGFYQFQGQRKDCDEYWNGGTASSVDLSQSSDETLVIEYSVNCKGNSRVATKKFLLEIGSNSEGGTSTTVLSSDVGTSSSEPENSSSNQISSTEMSSEAFYSSAFDASTCAVYSTWEATDYILGQRILSNSNEVYSCIDAIRCNDSNQSPTLGNIWVEAWALDGNCLENDGCEHPKWEIKSYSAEDVVVGADGKLYECKGHPYTGWCGQSAYEPAVGGFWSSAWNALNQTCD